jgi:hypothetical protein
MTKREAERREKQRETSLTDGADTPWTMPVPAAGRKYYAAGKNQSYDLAHEWLRSGTGLPCVRVGARGIRALPRVIEAQLSGKTDV